MSIAGLNSTGRIWRWHNLPASDDDVGGSIPSGTVLKDPVFCRIEPMPATQVLLEQGLELPEMLEALLAYSGDPLDIQHNDQLEIYAPLISPHYNHRFRIVGFRHSPQQSGSKFIEVVMKRHDISRTEDLQ